MKKAVVTGAKGFVGTASCKELSASGIEVVAVVRSNMADVKKYNNFPI